MRRLGYVALKRLALEILGWTLVVLGIAALFLPGPGLLMLFSGMVVLSQQYEWFERRVDPVKRLALEGASKGVQSWPRIAASMLGVAWLAGIGIFWGCSRRLPTGGPSTPNGG
ncbi:PGPGW domain-containing protein [Dietzia aerolata]|uniref:PGPGW domain-containing protein n=1 Tax=Dietzia aerolata TaxID=595984 RepID=UPI003629D06A